MNRKGPIRILHVVYRMNRAGVGTWLMNILRHVDRERFQMDFLVHTTQPYAYDDEIRALGSRLIPCLHPRRPWLYARSFKRILREHGPYDVVHSHVQDHSGYVLRLAHRAGVPLRIAHSHTDTSALWAKAGLLRRLYLALTNRWIARHAMIGVAASQQAAVALFGRDWESDSRWRILYYGVDFTPFHTTTDPAAVRAELGIPPSAFVIGHVGRFVEQKNHAFLVDIAAEVAKREPRTRLLLVGDGPLRPAIEQQVGQAGLTDRVIFAGVRSDVPRLMLGAMDVFLFPSLFEGLGLVLVEGQAAGLRCVLSDVVPEEADVVKLLVQRLSLRQPASVWAAAVLEARDAAVAITHPEALGLMENSCFNILTGAKKLEDFYLVHTNVGVSPGPDEASW